MASINNSRYVYFLFSNSQFKDRTNIESEVGMKYTPGSVLKNGQWRIYTEMTSNPDNVKYPDSKVVASGYLRDIKYKPEEKIKKRSK